MITQYFFLCLVHNTWCMMSTELWNCILFFSCDSRCGSLPYLLHTIFSSDNITNDSFTEFSMWFITTTMTHSTNITNLILLQSSGEKLEFFHLVYPCRTYSHCSGFHQSFASFMFGLGSFICISFGEVLTIHENQSRGPHSGVYLG